MQLYEEAGIPELSFEKSGNYSALCDRTDWLLEPWRSKEDMLPDDLLL